MVSAFVDHLWQSTCCCALMELLALLVRADFARLRLWMWRIAALKFLFPFALLYAVGQWLGFPVPHSADPPPQFLVEWIEEWTPIFRPAHVSGLTGVAAFFAVMLAALCACACGLWIRRRLRAELARTAAEAVREERDVDDRLPRPGFIASALLAACALLSVVVPSTAGAIADRQWQREVLMSNLRSLRSARIEMSGAAAGMGARYRVSAAANGVLIRNATVRELVGLAYGVKVFFVRGDHFYEAGEEDWLLVPRYDVRVVGTVREPESFDPYALHQAMTRLLAERFGLEIYVNEDCQPPCGRYGVAMPAARL